MGFKKFVTHPTRNSKHYSFSCGNYGIKKAETLVNKGFQRDGLDRSRTSDPHLVESIWPNQASLAQLNKS